MNVLANIILDMQRPAHTVVYAVQNDKLTRKITAQLVNAGIPWTVPTGALMMIRYSKPDGTTGFYDTDEAGATAYTISGSTVTFTMVQQALAVAGNVAVQLSFYTAGGDQLSTFAFVITVQPSVYNDAEIISSDYFNVLAGTIGEIAAEIQQFETALAAGYGAPLVASTVAGMTDHAKIYVYTGSESGYVSGNWYYWNGTAWTSGGVYNAVAVDLDATLTSATKPAQAKAVGDAVSELKSDINAADNNLNVKLRLAFRSGGINSATGRNITNANRAKTTHYNLKKGARYTCSAGYEFCAFEYDLSTLSGSSGTYVGPKIDSYVTEYLATDNATVAFVVRKDDDSVISDLSVIAMYISYQQEYMDNSVSEDGLSVNVVGSIISDKVIVGPNGNETSNANYSTTDFIPVSAGDVLLVNATFGGTSNSNNYTGLYGYDSNKTLVSSLLTPEKAFGWKSYGYIDDSVAVLQNFKYTVPSGISFVRMSSRTTGIDSQPPVIYKMNYVETVETVSEAVGAINQVGGFTQGSLNSDGTETSATNRLRSPYIDMTGKEFKISANGQKIAFCLYDSSKTFLLNSGWKYSDFTLIPVQTAKYVRFVVAETDDSTITVSDLDAVITSADGLKKNEQESESPINGFIKTSYCGNVEMIMHRGYNSIAPENTAPAFKLARQIGFSAIETDIQLTSDSVPVILHDQTINRTSNGTGNVYDKTLDQLKALDFGSWKSSMWTGTTIPTFEEMIALCKKIGLSVYVEIKQESPWTQALITSCVELVRKYGMKEHVTWISFSDTILGYVKTADETARLGFLMTTYTTSAVDTCLGLRTGKNEVLAVTRYDLLSSSVLEYMVEKNVPLAAYLFDKNTDADAMQSYVTAALTNEFNAMEYIYKKNISLS